MVNEGTDRLRGAAPAYDDIEAKRARAGVAAALFAESASGDGSAPSFERVAVGRYEIESRLGAGGMGVVYRAHDPDLDRAVAVKLLHPDSGSDSGVDSAGADKARARLLREARAMAKLSHPNVITVYDVGTTDGQVFVAMELVVGSDLRRWLERRRSAGWREILALFIAAGRGLEAAHEVALVHRDFKPENVLVGDDGRVRVLDFGLARVHRPIDSPTDAGPGARQRTDADPSESGVAPLPSTALSGGLTETGALVGTPLYIAPEIYAGKPADERSDQFAFCASLYEGVYRALPFGSRNFAAHVDAVAAGRLVEPPADSPVPASLWLIIARGLAPKPGDRYSDMGSLLAALEREREPSAAVVAGRQGSLRWFGLVLAGLLGLMGLLGFELGWFGGDASLPAPNLDSRRSDFAEAPELAGTTGAPVEALERPLAVIVDPVEPAASETGSETGSEPGPASDNGPDSQAKLKSHGWCHLHEDRYTLIERSSTRRARLVHQGQCYVCRDERRPSRTRNFSPRDCARYLLCGSASAKECE